MSQKTKASMYKSKSSVKSNWWEGDETPDETEQSEDEQEEFNPDFQVDEENEMAKLKEIGDKMKSLNSKRSLAELLEEDKTRKLIKAEHEEKFFISTADQRNFDEEIKANNGLEDHGDGSFVGRKACIPGCFAGDNVIVEDRWEGGYRKGNEVTGIRNRVRAGIQHYEYDLYAMYAAEEDRNKVVIYTTTLGVDKKLVADCDRATTIIRNMKVRWEERDIFNFEEHKDEFLVRKGLKPGASLSEHLPAIYIDGQYIGRLDELQALADCGDLRVRLAEFDKLYERHKCTDCQGTGKLVCPDCKGKKVKKRNRFGKLRCGECDVNAQVDCKGCYLPSEILRM
ncbi:unnamed protein product [Oikopleura dioica]|uniref:Uncharacterized protein n=1 Tax=Oikopleura dioica TaxID=34765 RepID=E4X301_OIKDI|nr:unnamed protein product [Oikopleura dioica]